MFCPECRQEFNPGVTECSDCKIPLVAVLPPDPALEEIELANIFVSGDETAAGLAESILTGAGIPYISNAEGVQDLLGLGRIGTGFNVFTGPIVLQVDARKADEARGLLAHISQNSLADSEPETTDKP